MTTRRAAMAAWERPSAIKGEHLGLVGERLPEEVGGIARCSGDLEARLPKHADDACAYQCFVIRDDDAHWDDGAHESRL